MHFSSVFHRPPTGLSASRPGREPSQALVIHLFFAAAAVPVRLSTHTLGIIAARAVPPYLFHELRTGPESEIRVQKTSSNAEAEPYRGPQRCPVGTNFVAGVV